MHGDDGDHGTGIFHKTELVGLILTGGVASVVTPELFGPRNPGQAAVAACAAPAADPTIKQKNAAFLMGQR